MTRLHPAQIRLLSFLALTPSAGFVGLTQIGQGQQIRLRDDLFASSLVARGWAEVAPHCRAAVRISDAGRMALVAAVSVVGIRFWERRSS